MLHLGPYAGRFCSQESWPLLAKAEELAWKRIVLEDKHIRIGSIRGKSH